MTWSMRRALSATGAVLPGLICLTLQGCSQTPSLTDRRPMVRDSAASGCDQGAAHFQHSAPGPEVLKGQLSGLPANLMGVWGASSTAVFAVGSEGKVIFFNGTDWVAQESTTKETLTSVWGTAANDVWAAGFNGVVIHFDGVKWSDSSPPALVFVPPDQDAGPPKGDAAIGFRRNLWGLWAAGGPGTQALYAVGDRGLVLHWAKNAWSRIPSDVEDHLFDVWGSSATQVYIVGDFGTLLSGGASGLSKVNTGVSRMLTSVWGNGGHIYAAGQNGTLLHGQGGSWSSIDGLPKQVLRAIWGPASDPQSLYLAGIDGTLLRLGGGPEFAAPKVELFTCLTSNRLDGLWGTEVPAGPAAADAGQQTEPRLWVVGVSGTVITGP